MKHEWRYGAPVCFSYWPGALNLSEYHGCRFWYLTQSGKAVIVVWDNAIRRTPPYPLLVEEWRLMALTSHEPPPMPVWASKQVRANIHQAIVSSPLAVALRRRAALSV